MYRRPLTTWGRAIRINRILARSIRIHFRGHQDTPAGRRTPQFHTQGLPQIAAHPGGPHVVESNNRRIEDRSRGGGIPKSATDGATYGRMRTRQEGRNKYAQAAIMEATLGNRKSRERAGAEQGHSSARPGGGIDGQGSGMTRRSLDPTMRRASKRGED